MLLKSNYLLYLIIFVLVAGCSQSETERPDSVRRKSPIAIARALHPATDTYIKIVYGQPYKKGRTVFGKLVPYNEVWRTGANEATELTTTGDILLACNELTAGTYALLSIPDKNEWTIIINNKLGQWGAFDYQKEYDELRIEADPHKIDATVEAFTVEFTEVIADSTAILMQWDQTEVRIPVTFLPSD